MAEASLAVSTYYAPGWPLSYGDEDDAMAMIIEALEQDPNSMELLAQYGGLLFSTGKRREALQMYKAALQNINSDALTGREALKQFRQAELEAKIKELGKVTLS